MVTMVRKQVYLRPGQDAALKRLAEARGATEAEIIREAIDLLFEEVARRRRADAAWEDAVALMESRAQYATGDQGEPDRGWTRDELYTDGPNAYADDADPN